MNRSIVTTAIGLLVVVATACADSTAAEPLDTSPVSEPSAPTPEPPQTDPPMPVTTMAPPKTTLPPPVTTAAPPTTVPPTTVPPTTVPPPKPTVPPTTVAPPKPTVPPTAPPAHPNGALCLVGDWTISDAELNQYFDIVANNAGFQSIDSTGVIRLRFTEDSFEWTNDYATSMMVGDVTYESTSSGGFYGAYSEAGGVISGMTIRDNRNGTVTQDGEPVDGVGDLFAGIFPAHPMDSMLFSCNGPTLMVEAGPLANTRHAVRLTPA